MTFEIRGLNMEKMLREAQKEGISLRRVRRTAQRSVRVEVPLGQGKRFCALCAQFGWEATEIRAGMLLGAIRFSGRRPMLVVGAALCLLIVALSSAMMLDIHVMGAEQYEPQIRRILNEEGVFPGRMKRSLSLDALRERLLFSLPGITYAALRYSGSVLEVDCHRTAEGEVLQKGGEGLDLSAQEAGIITRLSVSAGTPQVAVGEAVYAGQLLVKGEERTEKGATTPVRAQAQVYARVWAQGEARASLIRETVQETGRVRRRVWIETPWHMRLLEDAQPFEEQETDIRSEMIVDLFVPLIRKTQTYREIRILRHRGEQTDAASMAQGAAEKLAKKQLPADALILDKWVDYSMIDNEFVYASVVLEYERDIAVRMSAQEMRSMDR